MRPIKPPRPVSKFQRRLKSVITKIVYWAKWVSFLLSYVSSNAFAYYLTKYFQEKAIETNPNDFLSRNFGTSLVMSFYAVLLVYLILLIPFCLVHFAGKPNFVRQLEKKYLTCRWLPDFLLSLLNLGMDISSPILSAYMGSKFEAEGIHIITWVSFSIIFMSSALSSIQEFGSIDSCIAVVLGLLFSKTDAPRILAEKMGVDFIGNKKVFLILFASFVPAFRRACVPLLKILDKWSCSPYCWAEFMERRYPVPNGEMSKGKGAVLDDIEAGMGRRQSASDSQIGSSKKGPPFKVLRGTSHRD